MLKKIAKVILMPLFFFLMFVASSVADNNCRELTGQWYAYNPGINRQGTSSIQQEGERVNLVNEVGQRHYGTFIDPDTLRVDVGGGQMISGDIVNKGKRINWSN